MGGQHPGLQTLIASLPLFRGTDARALIQLANAARLRSAEAKESIYAQGDAAQAVFCVLVGQVRRTIVSPEGNEKVIEIVTDGHHFGLAESIADVPRTSSAIAVTRLTLVEIARAGLQSAMAASAALGRQIQVALAVRHLALERQIAAAHFHSGCRRLLDYLLDIAGPPAEGHETRVVLPLSKRLLAERLGVTAETLSRAFRELSAAGLIAVDGRNITLLAKLAERRHAAHFDPLPAGQGGRRRSDAWEAAGAPPLASRACL